jgi:glucose/mannose-6-phosphate isomerase
MFDVIRNFASQLSYESEVINPLAPRRYERYVVCGMGGSGHPGELLAAWDSKLPVTVHRDYGLPPLPTDVLEESLVIISSYSGNTEETLEAFHQARKLNLPNISITIGGKLLELAKAAKSPYIQMPDWHLQPREALGLSFRAHLTALGLEGGLREAAALAASLKPADYENAGKELARKLQGSVPLIYASTRNRIIAYVWKIKLNETSKIPAFSNVFPELNHNEMTAFDVQPSTAELSKKFHFVFLADDDDHPQIRKRMDVTARLFRDRNFAVETVKLDGPSRLGKIFSSIVLADWVAAYTAQAYGVEPTEVAMQENLKKAL